MDTLDKVKKSLAAGEIPEERIQIREWDDSRSVVKKILHIQVSSNTVSVEYDDGGRQRMPLTHLIQSVELFNDKEKEAI
jgi:hypothetical protein